MSDPDLSPSRVGESIIPTPNLPLPEPSDTPSRLPISWSFLLGPLLAAILPSFVTNLLGLKAQVAAVDDETWTGSPCSFDPEKGAQSRAVLVTVPPEKMDRVLKKARARGAKMTGVLHQVVVKALSSALLVSGDGACET